MPKVQKALVKAFNKILPKMRLTTADILQGKVHYLEQPWQVPPLTLDAKIGLDFAQAVFDQHLAINEKELYAFWEDSMPLLKTDPASIITRSKGYMRLVSALRMPAGERLLRFSIPEGFPHAVTDYAGVILSLECVEALRLAGLTKELHTGPSDYWAVTPEGRTFGV